MVMGKQFKQMRGMLLEQNDQITTKIIFHFTYWKNQIIKKKKKKKTKSKTK
jgi:hypothetical protein